MNFSAKNHITLNTFINKYVLFFESTFTFFIFIKETL